MSNQYYSCLHFESCIPEGSNNVISIHDKASRLDDPRYIYLQTDIPSSGCSNTAMKWTRQRQWRCAVAWRKAHHPTHWGSWQNTNTSSSISPEHSESSENFPKHCIKARDSQQQTTEANLERVNSCDLDKEGLTGEIPLSLVAVEETTVDERLNRVFKEEGRSVFLAQLAAIFSDLTLIAPRAAVSNEAFSSRKKGIRWAGTDRFRKIQSAR